MWEILLYLVVIAGAFALAFFQYRRTSGKTTAKNKFLLAMRFISYLAILALLLNPSFLQHTYIVEKPRLLVAVDNSSSIATLETPQKVFNFIETLRNDTRLEERFEIEWYRFGTALNSLDSVDFTESRTQISEAMETLQQLHKGATAPLVLLTDGNQTLGNDYEYSSRSYVNPVFPVVVGDTAVYADLLIQQLNVNRYTNWKQRFPVEVSLLYKGEGTMRSQFTIHAGNTLLHSETIVFSGENKAVTRLVEVFADKIGVQTLRAEITPFPAEKNTTNNSTFFAIEVLDEKASIAIVSRIQHPDLGALEQLIGENEQWETKRLLPEEAATKIEGSQLVILYQPDASFANLFEMIARSGINVFLVVGSHTDTSFINSIQEDFSIRNFSRTEEVQAEFSTAYRSFLADDIGFSALPPLHAYLGEVHFSQPPDVLLYKRVRNVVTAEPLLATFERDNRKMAALFGEHLWRWRMEIYRNTNSFKDFDGFFGKLIRYLLSDTRKSRLHVFANSFYYGYEGVKITAEFFDKEYTFNPNGRLEIKVENTTTGATGLYPLLLKNRRYEVDLSVLSPGSYNYTLTETGERISQSGKFVIIPFEIEKQFTSANAEKLRQLALATGGKRYTVNEAEQLAQALLNDERFIPVQKEIKTQRSLIHWKYLMAIMLLSLSAEWFVRKYRGLV